jgi:hypothetical protein
MEHLYRRVSFGNRRFGAPRDFEDQIVAAKAKA